MFGRWPFPTAVGHAPNDDVINAVAAPDRTAILHMGMDGRTVKLSEVDRRPVEKNRRHDEVAELRAKAEASRFWNRHHPISQSEGNKVYSCLQREKEEGARTTPLRVQVQALPTFFNACSDSCGF